MRRILFLSHRVPYPPNKGDKIRAWNILRSLAVNYPVDLGTFIDAAEDVRHVPTLENVCASVYWRRLSPKLARLRSLRCLAIGAPLTEGYFGDPVFAAAADELIRVHSPDIVYVYSSAMAQYIRKAQPGIRIIVDMVDVDSEKWRQYAEVSAGVVRWIYRREARLLLKLEREAARIGDAVVFVSRSEAELFRQLAPEAAGRTHVIENGVDVKYFARSGDVKNPFGDRPAIVFTGLMNYRPNVDAMKWFVAEVMPLVRSHPKRPVLWIVGANPSKVVRSLSSSDVYVTGRVPDVRPYLAHAAAVVAPLRIGRGVQNKVLEAMAMGAALVLTPEAREGLDRCRDDEFLTATGSDAFAAALNRILNGEADQIGARARARVMKDYQWATTLAPITDLIDGPGDPVASSMEARDSAA